MQHTLNYSSTSEWVASEGEMEGKTMREVEKEGRKGDEQERKRGGSKGGKKRDREAG